MLMDDIERYIALRRSLGAGLKRAKQHLTSFAGFATDKGERHIRAQTAGRDGADPGHAAAPA